MRLLSIKTHCKSFKLLKIIPVLFLVTLSVSWPGPTALAATPLPVFPDPAMQACMDRLAAENNWQFAENVTEFECTDCGVRQIEGIDALVNLERLDLSGNSIDDMYTNTGILNHLNQLTELNLRSNRLIGLPLLNNLSQLKNSIYRITLSSCKKLCFPLSI